MAESINIIQPESWVQNYADELYVFAMSKTGNPELSEDLVQETFLGALKSMQNFKGNSSEKTWLYAILKFKIADHYKKASTKNELVSSKIHKNENHEKDPYFMEDGGWHNKMRPTDWGIDYSCPVENKELSMVLNKCIEKLAHTQKHLVRLKMIEEVEVTQICKELQITATNYWVIIHRAKLQLRSCLEKNWFKA